MKFEEARDELLTTLVNGGMDQATAKRKLRNWTRRIEDRTVKHFLSGRAAGAGKKAVRNN